jgi:hypothetical protein
MAKRTVGKPRPQRVQIGVAARPERADRQDVSAFSRGFNASPRPDCAVIAVAQLSRQVEQRPTNDRCSPTRRVIQPA